MTGRHLGSVVFVAFVPSIVVIALGNEVGDLFGGFDKYANTAIQDWGVPGLAVAIVKDESVVFANGYGRLDIEDRGEVDTKSIFPIASITKAFNATAIAILVDEGRLQWDDRVAECLPEFELCDGYLTREVTIADLLSHRTCVEDPILLMYTGVGRKELVRRARLLRPIAPFRSTCRYNNLMIDVAGEILERKTQQSWEEVVEDRILKPLGMTSTVADVTKLNGLSNVATSYVDIDDQLRKDPTWNLPLSEGWKKYREAIRPDGSICSNVEDMAKILILHMRNGQFESSRLLEADTALEMQELHSTLAFKPAEASKLPFPKIVSGYGFGWEIRDYRGRKVVFHRGSTGAVLAFMPEEKIGLVVLSNLNRGLQYMMMHDIFDLLLGIPRGWSNEDWLSAIIETEKKELKAHEEQLLSQRDTSRQQSYPLEDYAGTYHSDLLGDLTITLSGGKLHMQLGANDNCTAELEHWRDEQFRGKFQIRHLEDWMFTFSRFNGSRPTRLEVSDSRSKETLGSFGRNP